MDIKNIQISRKYATAFLNLHFNKINEKTFLNMVFAFNYLKPQKELFQLLLLPNLFTKKLNIISFLVNKFDLPLELIQLSNILFQKKSIHLFIDILRELIVLYQEKARTILFDVSSAEALNDNETQDIKIFLEKKSGDKIIESYKVNKILIAGIRAKSKDYLWEHSVAKQLRNIQKLID